jgi:hypothetical protein
VWVFVRTRLVLPVEADTARLKHSAGVGQQGANDRFKWRRKCAISISVQP